jgi:hypothetical protein
LRRRLTQVRERVTEAGLEPATVDEAIETAPEGLVIRAVLHTNTIVSGVGRDGPPGVVLDVALAGHFEIVTSPAQLEELRRVFAC